MTARLFLQVLHHSSFTSLSDARRGSLSSTRTPSADRHLHPIVIVKELQVTYNFFSQFMSYILNMLVCVCIILLDNLLQCLLFIVMIDLSRTCDSTVILICNALVMFMIYP
jgi:hypothetical protein